ncbi:MAG: response regulator transcription factor [Armatimonadetes bacterium]|nr:response regulator transcription factor [Armatimonadota bacterium]
MSTIKLLIVDDHLMIREGLVAMLSSYPDLQIAGSCESAFEALEFLAHTVPDVILMDIKMKDKNGLDATREIKAKFPEVKVLILTIYEDMESVRLSLQAGAAGYLLKQVSQEKLAESIKRVYHGETVIDPSLIGQLVNDYAKMTQGFLTQLKSRVELEGKGLTPRENEVLKYLAQGLTNKEISSKTHLAIDTVKTHLRSIYRKLGVKNRSQAITLLNRQNKAFEI